MSQIIDGKALADRLGDKLKTKLGALKERPLVVSILIGSDPNSLLYTQMKQKKADEFYIDFLPMKFSVNTSFENVAKKIRSLNETDEVKGIMIQLPLSRDFLKDKTKWDLINLIDSKKDIDGMKEDSPFVSATVLGVMKILEEVIAISRSEEAIPVSSEIASEKAPRDDASAISLRDDASAISLRDDENWYKETVFGVVGSEGEVGKPLVEQLSMKNAHKILRLDKRNPDCNFDDLQEADVVISCTGVQSLVNSEMIKEGAILIDVGLGDFDPSTYEKAKMYTPKFGGVGPMTIYSLMENILEASKNG